MTKHHPMDRLHHHLGKASEHAVNVQQEAERAARAHSERTATEQANDVSVSLTPDGG